MKKHKTFLIIGIIALLLEIVLAIYLDFQFLFWLLLATGIYVVILTIINLKNSLDKRNFNLIIVALSINALYSGFNTLKEGMPTSSAGIAWITGSFLSIFLGIILLAAFLSIIIGRILSYIFGEKGEYMSYFSKIFLVFTILFIYMVYSGGY